MPQLQPKQGRPWLADGSCVRLRPERANHVWAQGPDSQPACDDCGDVTLGRPSVSDCGEAVVSGCDAPEVLQPADHALDGVAASVERGAEAALLTPVCPGRDIRHRGAGFDGALGGDSHRRRGRRSPGRLRELPRSAPRRRGGRLCCRLRGGTRSACRLGLPRRRSCWSAHRAAGPSRQAAMGSPTARWRARAPPFPPEALRCALASVASSNTSMGGPPAAASAAKRRRHTPLIAEANIAVVQRLRRAVLARRMPTRTTRPQHMHDAADHTTVVHPGLAACVRRQKRRKALHLRLARIAARKERACHHERHRDDVEAAHGVAEAAAVLPRAVEEVAEPAAQPRPACRPVVTRAAQAFIPRPRGRAR